MSIQCSLLFSLFVSITSVSSAQTAEVTPVLHSTVVEATVPKPINRPAGYPGGIRAFSAFFTQHLTYPEVARQYAIEGDVVVEFIITELGDLVQLRVVEPLGYGCDEVALKAVRAMPDWQPAYKGGIAQRTRVRVPIAFRLN